MSEPEGINALNKANQSIVKLLTTVASWVLAAMMFLTFANVVARYFFNSPILGASEIIPLMMAIVIPFSIVFCAQNREHISVDFILERFSDSTRKVINCLISLLMLVLFIPLTWQTFIYVIDEYESNLTTETLYISVYPFIFLVAIAFSALTLILLAQFFSHLSEVFSKWTRS